MDTLRASSKQKALHQLEWFPSTMQEEFEKAATLKQPSRMHQIRKYLDEQKE